MAYNESQVVEIIEAIGKVHNEFRGKTDTQLESIYKNIAAQQQQLNAIETAVARGTGGGGSSLDGDFGTHQAPRGKFAIAVDGKRIPFLTKRDRLSAHYPAGPGEETYLADFVRNSLGLRPQGSVLERDSSTVPVSVSSRIIDMIRAKARLIQAGAGTIIIEGPTNLCRIDGDPVVYEHAEGATDISESLPVFNPVALNPKSLVALIPLSMEIVQDSPNLDLALSLSLAGAFALKLDTLGLATILADLTIPTSSEGEDTETWLGTLAAVKSMLAVDQDLPQAIISSPGDYIERAGAVAVEAGTWLGVPPVLANCADLFTSGMADGVAILGDFEKGFIIAVRQELRLEVVRWAKATTASHVLVAYSRMAGYVMQPNALYIQNKSVGE